MERNNQEKWSKDICFTVIVLKITVDWMLFHLFLPDSYQIGVVLLMVTPVLTMFIV